MTDLILARTEELETRAVDGEIVLLDLRSQRYMSLNRTGATLWPLIVEGVPRDQLAAELCAAHGITLDVAQRDVDALVAQLKDADLLQSDEDAAAPNPG